MGDDDAMHEGISKYLGASYTYGTRVHTQRPGPRSYKYIRARAGHLSLHSTVSGRSPGADESATNEEFFAKVEGLLEEAPKTAALFSGLSANHGLEVVCV